MSGKGVVKNSHKMGALVSSVLEISQDLAKYEFVMAPLYTLRSSSYKKFKRSKTYTFPSKLRGNHRQVLDCFSSDL